jgi:hypothetical protein
MNLIRIALQTSILTSVVLTGLIINGDAARSQQRACVITDDGATICGKLTTVKKEAKKPAQSSGYRKEVNNFLYVLKGCKRSDMIVKCDLVIINKGVQRDLLLYAQQSKIIDVAGKSHSGSNVEIGGQSNYAVRTKIITGIDIYCNSYI